MSSKKTTHKSQKSSSRPVGRPTVYRPEYCKMLIEHMAKPFSYETFGAIIEVSREVLYLWEKKHPEFLHAKRIGRMKQQLALEKMLKGQTMGTIKGGNASSLIFYMKNITNFRDDPPVQEDAYEEMEFYEE